MTPRALSISACLSVAAACAVPELVPEEEMDQLGTQAWQEMKAQTPEVSDPAVVAFVDKVARRVVEASDLRDKDVEVAVFASEQVNAFALPGGYIGVYQGILPVAQNEAGLAAILAHEVVHLSSEHANERISQQMLTELALTGASEAFRTSKNYDTIMAALGLGSELGVTLPYTRGQESEADTTGVLVMARAGYLPTAAVEVWQRMQAAQQGSQTPAFLSTHPSTGQRIDDLQQQMPEAMRIYRSASPQYGEGEPIPRV